mmetsp:Transcript_5560/g.9071  ORF Transcript_5560/g.9071 Transcript_5560/m.9071 type:complete len:91 (-) Transcript_5560:1189-1461(-)
MNNHNSSGSDSVQLLETLLQSLSRRRTPQTSSTSIAHRFLNTHVFTGSAQEKSGSEHPLLDPPDTPDFGDQQEPDKTAAVDDVVELSSVV